MRATVSERNCRTTRSANTDDDDDGAAAAAAEDAEIGCIEVDAGAPIGNGGTMELLMVGAGAALATFEAGAVDAAAVEAPEPDAARGGVTGSGGGATTRGRAGDVGWCTAGTGCLPMPLPDPPAALDDEGDEEPVSASRAAGRRPGGRDMGGGGDAGTNDDGMDAAVDMVPDDEDGARPDELNLVDDPAPPRGG